MSTTKEVTITGLKPDSDVTGTVLVKDASSRVVDRVSWSSHSDASGSVTIDVKVANPAYTIEREQTMSSTSTSTPANHNTPGSSVSSLNDIAPIIFVVFALGLLIQMFLIYRLQATAPESDSISTYDQPDDLYDFSDFDKQMREKHQRSWS